jgi:methylenetetrahydrofolate--tRNA-(uracil-5-)-methyltransferase
MTEQVSIIGAGLAGVEAAYQLASRGIPVTLYEMRPKVTTPAHTTDLFGELVCSNSLGGESVQSANGLLKEELNILDSFFLRMARECRVPAGQSLAVDRMKLARQITENLKNTPHVKHITEEISNLEDHPGPTIIASGPLTSDPLAWYLTTLTLRKNLFFFDATCPIVSTESVDMNVCFKASRYGKGSPDFLNIPLDRDQYQELVRDLITAEKIEPRDFEKGLFFEACLPVEEIARRGGQALAFGPLKPVGLEDPRTGQMPHAVIQLRYDDLKRNFLQLVGFQTRLKWNEQKRVFRKIPGLSKAHFERYGRMHRNTYINAPLVLDRHLQLKTRPNLFFAGQLCGVEGYVESIATGLYAGLILASRIQGRSLPDLPPDTALGSLIHYITHAPWQHFKPTKFSFGLLPSLKGPRTTKRQRKEQKARRAIEQLTSWKESAGI